MLKAQEGNLFVAALAIIVVAKIGTKSEVSG
jgi:hypothetical protein